ncbi:MAG: lipoprotein signal peptidase [Campylobacterales bacterium]|nr:lipoprotein signal peptidase [Campylobacterales bacterium]
MRKNIPLFFGVAFTVFAIDQLIKFYFVEGFSWESECISFELHYNKGVAFSMFTFLGENLKWIQLLLISALVVYIFKDGYLKKYLLPSSILIGAAFSNLLDRFIHGGVVDYVYWHCGFDFAVFNFADMMIDFAIVLFLLKAYILERCATKKS